MKAMTVVLKLSVVGLLALMASPLSVWAETGSPSDPYTIGSESDLSKLTQYGMGESGKGKCFQLTADIALTAKWPGIGTYAKTNPTDYFSGTFDGKGHKISNVVMTNAGTADGVNNYRGFFNQINGGTVRNLTIATTGFGATPPSGEYGCAAIAGAAYNATIENCVAEGTISGSHNVGGIVIRIKDTSVIRCTNRANVTGSYTKVAGICTLSQESTTGCLIDRCVNEGTIMAANGANAGRDGVAGILAYANDNGLTIRYCNNKGFIGTMGWVSSEAKVMQILGYSYGCAPTLIGNTDAITKTGGEIVYRNNFSMRTSSVGVPTPRWLSQSYIDGDLLKGGGSTGGGESDVNESEYQDGWYVGRDGDLSGESFVLCRPFTGDNDSIVPTHNRCSIFISSNQTVVDPGKDHRTHVFQSFGNEFKNGVLRVQVDMHAAEYNCRNNNNFFIGPLFKKYLNPAWGMSLPKYPGYFGFNLDPYSDYVLKNYYFGGDGTGGVAGTPVYNGVFKSNVIIGNWYRFVVDFDLDRNQFSGHIYAMGSTQPELSTPNGELMDTLEPVHFFSDRSEDTGGIAGIVMRDCGSVSTGRKTEPNRAPAADNIRLWWRAAGSDFTDNDLFYENDFTARRSRAIQPVPTTTATFEMAQTTVDDTFSTYTANAVADLPGHKLVWDGTNVKEAQPYGLDGWRRLNGMGRVNFSVASYGSSANKMMAATGLSDDDNRFGVIAQNLGDKITSGQVKLQFDIRVPDKIRSAPSTANLYGMLAPESYLNSGDDDSQANLYAARSGFQGANNSSAFNFAAIGGSTYTAEGAQAGHWYRMVQTVDLGTKTFDSETYDTGTTPLASDASPTGEPVFRRTGVALKNQNVADISCFAFFIGGAAVPSEGEAGIIFIDNIRVWKRAAGKEDWTKVYYNDFGTRVRYNVPKTFCSLASLPDVTGEDGWVMRNRTFAKPTVFGSANPALSLDNSKGSDYLWAMQPIGEAITDGKIRFRADFRPPREWTTTHNTATSGSLMLGNDLMYMGNRFMTSQLPDCLTQFQIRFGVGPQATTSDDYRHSRFTDNKLFYYNSSGSKTFFANKVDVTHWYRFEAKSDVRRGTFDLKVYDMGATHPELETPNPKTVFAHVENVPYRMPLAEGQGLSAICATILGNEKETPWMELDNGLCYIDNIEITRAAGLLIIVK